jgi:hypothetical protein
VLGGCLLHVRDDLVGLVEAALPDKPARRLGQLEAQEDGDEREERAHRVHPAPAGGEVLAGERERQALGPRLGRVVSSRPSQIPFLVVAAVIGMFGVETRNKRFEEISP